MLKLNVNQAKAADSLGSALKETGKYIGVITRAEKLESEKGTVGLGLSFKSEDGQVADYLNIWHTKGNGESLFGLKTVNAILACAKVKEAREGAIKAEVWDNIARARVKVEVNGYPDLMGKPIGFLLQKTLESKQDGSDRETVTIFGVFDPATELTATEILEKKTNPVRLPLMVESLMNHPVRDNRKASAKQSQRPAATHQSQSSGADDPFGDMNDDIPF